MLFFRDAKINDEKLMALEVGRAPIDGFEVLKLFLDFIHLRSGLLEVYDQEYPLVDVRELLPSFEPQFTEYKNLPGFSMIALDREIDYQNEPFQFTLIPYADDPVFGPADKKGRRRYDLHPLGRAAELIRAHLPEHLRDAFTTMVWGRDITALPRYGMVSPYLFEMDRAHVIAADHQGRYRLRGVFASFPSNLDTELKGFGLRVGKFARNDNLRYAMNRQFIYHFLMETYGFPIASERRTSAALFARQLCRAKQSFLIKVLGNSDRTITTMHHPEPGKPFPRIEKAALVRMPAMDGEVHKRLADGGYYVDPENRVVLVRVTYQQRRYHHQNVIEDRALSVDRQEIVHPYTGRTIDDINFLQDKGSLVLQINDIIRGEHQGSITYRGRETINGTRRHTQRLKFIVAWTRKHERRLVDYADDTYRKVKELLNSYILDPGLKDAFKRRRKLHREVLVTITRLNQARALKELERIAMRRPAHGRPPGYFETYRAASDFIDRNTDFLLSFYDNLFEKALGLLDYLLKDRYVAHKYLGPDPGLETDYGQKVKKAHAELTRARNKLETLYRDAAA